MISYCYVILPLSPMFLSLRRSSRLRLSTTLLGDDTGQLVDLALGTSESTELL